MREHLLRAYSQSQLGSRGGVHSPLSLSSVLSAVGHGLVDPKTSGVGIFENRSGEEFHVNSLLTRLREN